VVYKVTNVIVSNKAVGAVTLTLSWTDSSASATYRFCTTYSIAAATLPVSVDVGDLVLESGDTLQATASANTSLDITVGYAEVTQ
jgi:hypothetical protein